MITFLAESRQYKVYSICDNVYLKRKATCRSLDDFDETDVLIGWIYGDPSGALIMPCEKHVVVAGCGLTIFDIDSKQEQYLLADPDNITWTSALHQTDADDSQMEFRYIDYSEDHKPRVFKMNILTKVTSLLN